MDISDEKIEEGDRVYLPCVIDRIPEHEPNNEVIWCKGNNFVKR